MHLIFGATLSATKVGRMSIYMHKDRMGKGNDYVNPNILKSELTKILFDHIFQH